LPLDAQNWITCGNALRLDWLSLMGVHSRENSKNVKIYADDLFGAPLDQAKIDFEHEGGETYICGNPPYKGNADQNKEQKDDMKACLSSEFSKWKSLDYICGWFYLAQKYSNYTKTKYALVSTNSICQGQNISNFWKEMYRLGAKIDFAVTSFKWANLAQNNAGVTVVIVGGGSDSRPPYHIYENNEKRSVASINGYLVEGKDVWIEKESKSISNLGEMLKGNYYGLSDGLLMNGSEKIALISQGVQKKDIKIFKGSDELISGKLRYCLWFPKERDYLQYDIQEVTQRIESVRSKRLASPDPIPLAYEELGLCCE
jgi:hypothetical protein